MFLWLRAPVLLLFVLAVVEAAAYDALPSRAVDLSGHWVLNHAQSDNVERMLSERLARERERWRRQMERWHGGDGVLSQLDRDSLDAQTTRAARERAQRRRERELALYRRMLNISPTLRIEQDGRRIEIASAVETRRFEAGSRSQVSMPEGQLADLRAGWNGESFVIERKTRNGPSVVERFRLLRKTGQLEYQMTWRGQTELAGMKVRRIFDRREGAVAPREPSVGPVR
nr:hypothetical protein [Gammaproteobacteria bacterium]